MNNVGTQVFGWGIDLPRENRPGYPKENDPPQPMGNAHWIEPEQQVSGDLSVKDALRPVTPAYGTVVPPRGLSGAMRRLAYEIPPYKARRWMLLLLADRVDVLEHNVAPLATLLGGAAAVALGVVAYQKLVRD
jgi:hypothetical protein